MKKHSSLVRSAALAAAIAVGATVAPAAVVAPVAVAQDTAAPVSLIDASQDGNASLTIHKRELGNPNDAGAERDGTEIEGFNTGTPLKDAEFTIYKITGIDLKTNQGLQKAAGLKAEDFTVGTDGNVTYNGSVQGVGVDTQKSTKVTGEDGVAKFEKLSLAAYFVVESKAPVVEGKTYTPAAPFIAFVPMTKNGSANGNDASQAQGTEWNYNVHAYPKNYPNQGPDKKVEDSGKNAGQEVTYTVTGTAQFVPEGKQRSIFVIKDTLDSKLAAPTAETAKPVVTSTGTELDANDYKVDYEGQAIIMTLTESGLKKVNGGDKITLKFNAKVKDASTGIVPNKAQVFENDPANWEDTTGKPKDTPEVRTYYGNVEFTKVEAGNTSNALEGAVFTVYGATEGVTCKEAVKSEDNRITAGGTNEWTSSSDAANKGKVTITGLHVNDYADDTEGTKNKFIKYCLVETKSPKGFELLAEPVEFEINKAEVTETNDAGELVQKQNVTKQIGKLIEQKGYIENLKDTTPNLPMTGGMGIGILAAIGAAIIALGAFFARRSAKNS